MEVLIRPSHTLGDRHPFADLVDYPQQQQMVAARFISVIQRSFAEDVQHLSVDRQQVEMARLQTATEERRRAQMAFEIFRDMRHHGYAQERALDTLPAALRARLDGRPYTMADPNRLWTPT